MKIAAFDEKITEFADRKDVVSSGLAPFEKRLNESKRHRTSLYEAILFTLGAVPHTAPEDAIVVITDGSDNHSQRTATDVLRKLRETRTRLFVVYVPASPCLRN